jgi:energy-coupling factor transporter ATP-binding protein EcfA2
MFFTVLSSSVEALPSNYPKAFLIRDNWNDWFEFSTLFHLIVFDEENNKHKLGDVKIGQFGLSKAERSPQIPDAFNSLDENFFSLGQSDSYYAGLMNLSHAIREQVLNGLKDVVADLSLFNQAIDERVTKISLLRDVTPMTVRGQFHRLLNGGSRLSAYNFSYLLHNRSGSSIPAIDLEFEVEPESNPPTNVHILIGRNGVGKTRILNYMTRALVDEDAIPNQFGFFTSQDNKNKLEIFANIVSVTFSAFDDFEPLHENKDKTAGIKYSYIGLKRGINKGYKANPNPKSPYILASEFVRSLKACIQGSRINRWLKALEMLEADPIFSEIELASLSDIKVIDEFDKKARKIFGKLSSGHKIVLLTITRLVESVEERTLVLLDEPESHLHPPLLSAFTRALSELLVHRNGVAIIATHSPVLLQEVPRRCVWKLRRNGSEAIAERPEIETFGENVGTLTREVFGLEVTQSGFHKLLQDAVNQNKSFKQTMLMFDNELGSEARAILRALIVERDSEQEM